jgi:hypothetical protein
MLNHELLRNAIKTLIWFVVCATSVGTALAQDTLSTNIKRDVNHFLKQQNQVKEAMQVLEADVEAVKYKTRAITSKKEAKEFVSLAEKQIVVLKEAIVYYTEMLDLLYNIEATRDNGVRITRYGHFKNTTDYTFLPNIDPIKPPFVEDIASVPYDLVLDGTVIPSSVPDPYSSPIKSNNSNQDSFLILLPPNLPRRDPNSNTYLRPTPTPCNILTDEFDSFSNRRKLTSTSLSWFDFTPEQLKSYFTANSYINTKMQVGGVAKGNLYLIVDFTINAPNSSKLFGQFDKGATIELRLMSGQVVSLPSITTALPEETATATKYRITLLITRDQYKILKESETDMIRINWTSGYEDYPVTHINLLRDQLNGLVGHGI